MFNVLSDYYQQNIQYDTNLVQRKAKEVEEAAKASDAADIKSNLLIPSWESQSPASAESIETRRYKVHEIDMKKAISQVLKLDISRYLNYITNPEELRVVHQFLNVGAKHYPILEIKNYLETLSSWVKSKINEKEMVTRQEWMSKVSSAFKDVDDMDYVGCKGTLGYQGGFTCGLWTYFHVLTVGQLEDLKSEPHEVLDTMKSYVDKLSTCPMSKSNFLNVMDRISEEYQVRNTRDAIQNLWAAHNVINKFAADNGFAEDPKHPKDVWPGKQQCSACYDGEKVDSMAINEFLVDHFSKIIEHKSNVKPSMPATPSDNDFDDYEDIFNSEDYDEMFDDLDLDELTPGEPSPLASFLMFAIVFSICCGMFWYLRQMRKKKTVCFPFRKVRNENYSLWPRWWRPFLFKKLLFLINYRYYYFKYSIRSQKLRKQKLIRRSSPHNLCSFQGCIKWLGFPLSLHLFIQ